MNAHVLANAKAYAALIGAICTGLLGVFAADSVVGQVLTVVSIVATAVATWVVPNLDPAGKRQDESVQPPEDGGQRPILGKA